LHSPYVFGSVAQNLPYEKAKQPGVRKNLVRHKQQQIPVKEKLLYLCSLIFCATLALIILNNCVALFNYSVQISAVEKNVQAALARQHNLLLEKSHANSTKELQDFIASNALRRLPVRDISR
jgi:cell division protein FtsL